MIRRILLLSFLSGTLLAACVRHSPPADPLENPAAPNFLLAESDSTAIRLADTLMHTMGGRANWDSTRFLTWNFFNVRRHYWDRQTGRVRIESLRDSMTYLINVRDSSGVVYEGSQLLEAPVAEQRIQDGISIWINDSYWLVMPYKLKDSGVRLRYLDRDTLNDRPAERLELTFDGVGDTPENKYHVWIDKKSGLVSQWAYFKEAENDKPLFTSPWRDYNQYGKIMLSGDRGKNSLSDIGAPASLPDSLFQRL